MLCDEWLRVVERRYECWYVVGCSDVAEGDRSVARESAQLRAPHRRPPDISSEVVVIHRQDRSRNRPRVAVENIARAECFFANIPGKSNIPWTDILADVAAVDETADLSPLLRRNRALRLDREVGDALGGVQHAGRREGSGRAGVQTASAAAASIRVEWRICHEIELDEEHADEKEGPNTRVDKIGVLPEPSEPGATREIALENGTGVDISLSANRSANLRLEPAMQLVEPDRNDMVVVVTPRVTGDGAARLATAIVQTDHDRGSGPRDGPPRVAALRRPAREIVHLARVATLDPCVERIRCLHGTERGDTDKIEAESVRLRLQQLFDRQGLSD